MKKEYPRIVYLNGKWHKPEEARLSVFDRGFLFGDGVYEVISFYHGRPFVMGKHMARLRNSLSLSDIQFDTRDLPELILTSIDKAGLSQSHAVVYVQVTRGIAPRMHIYPTGSEPSLMMYAIPFPLGEARQKHIKVLLAEDKRWYRCNIKTISLMGNVQASEAAERAGAQEAVLARGNIITEGSHSNFFIVKDGVLHTHPADEYILPGIIRSQVIELARELEIPVQEKACSVSALYAADEAFITGTGSEITSVGRIIMDDRETELGSVPGNVTRKLQQAFRSITLG